MGRQKNRLQIKEQDYSPEEELEMEAGNLSDRVQSKDFKDIQQHKKKTQKL